MVGGRGAAGRGAAAVPGEPGPALQALRRLARARLGARPVDGGGLTGPAGAAFAIDVVGPRRPGIDRVRRGGVVGQSPDPRVGGLTSSAGRRLDPVGRTGPGEFGLIRLDRGLDHRRGPAGRERAGAGGAPETRSGEELSKSVAKAPRGGIGRDKNRGISTILLRCPGAIGAFATDLDKQRRRGPARGGTWRPGRAAAGRTTTTTSISTTGRDPRERRPAREHVT